jgi:hypothetical protein
MNYVNTSSNILILLLATYVVSYIIIYLATIYDLSARGKGSILDNPYLLKFMTMVSAVIYYTIYLLYQLSIKAYVFLYDIDIHSAILLGVILLSITITILYMKIY